MEFEVVEVAQAADGIWQGLDDAAEHAARHLALGGLLAHPTTGVYGLGGARGKAIDALLTRLKGRVGKTGFVYLVPDQRTARVEFPNADWPDLAVHLAAQFWPGPLTLVLEDGTPGGVAMRAEAHPVTRQVLERLVGAMSSTSLNRTGEPAAVTSREARYVLRALPQTDRPVLWLDAGPLSGPPPSTVVRISGETHEILREGAVSADRIREAIG
ncbi:MAG: Sua5/YciO/YrdC/YwlC family protein [Gemmatimonadota bacterium]|nr:Sua5/YciO/YrdC/YwlC family protein [Gemmatimonadota bacterium]